MKLVLYKDMEFNFEAVTEYAGEDHYPCNSDKAVVLSEVIDVDFTMLREKELIDKQVTVIEKQITKVRADAEASITTLNGRKQELLALECDK